MSVYFIKNTVTNKIKIGKSSDPHKRIRQLQNAAGDPLEMILLINTDSDKNTEETLHDLFIESRSLGEWFHPSKEILSFIEGYNTCLENRCFNTNNSELNFKKSKKDDYDPIPKFSVSIDEHTKKLLLIAAKERNKGIEDITYAMLQCAIEVYFKTTNREKLIRNYEE